MVPNGNNGLYHLVRFVQSLDLSRFYSPQIFYGVQVCLATLEPLFGFLQTISSFF